MNKPFKKMFFAVAVFTALQGATSFPGWAEDLREDGHFLLGYTSSQKAPLPSQEQQEALECYRLASEGDVEGSYSLGELYEIGYGIPQNYAQALKWYKIAFKRGKAEAATCIGDLYYYGQGYLDGVLGDYEKALKWYKRAFEKGDRHAAGLIGDMYESGTGVHPDPETALRWYEML
jgi:hypothetical protein